MAAAGPAQTGHPKEPCRPTPAVFAEIAREGKAVEIDAASAGSIDIAPPIRESASERSPPCGSLPAVKRARR